MGYKDAGVDIDRGNEAVRRIQPWALKTYRPEVVVGVGGFAGSFAWQQSGVLLAGADGVGSKLLIAQELSKVDTIGIDLVAMNVNDILAQGGEPLFFLDYIATHEIVPSTIEQLIQGVAEGCMRAHCTLLGGETAELPDLYQPTHFDLAGFCVGRQAYTPPEPVEEGDVLLGLASSGFHSNGYALLRKIVRDNQLDWNRSYPEIEPTTLGESFLTPTQIYVQAVQTLWTRVSVKAMAHITGGGLTENVPRTLPQGFAAMIDSRSWPRTALMQWIQKLGPVDDDEWRRTFNDGIGFTVVIAPKHLESAQSVLEDQGIKSYAIGRIVQTSEKQGVIWT